MTFDMQTATDYYRQFDEEKLARTRTHAILRRSRPPEQVCRRCKRMVRAVRFPAWRCYTCTTDRDLCKRCMRETHFANPYHTVGWWNGKFHQKAWLRDVGVAIYLCEHADPFAGTQCPSIPATAILPPGFDDLDPEGYALRSTPVEEFVSMTAEGGLDKGENEDDASNFGLDDDLLSRLATLPLDDLDVEASTPQVADEVDEDEEARDRSRTSASTSRGRGTHPLRDARGLKIMIIGDIAHMHGIGVQFCHCRDARRRDEQLLEYGIYPASSDRPSTGFTLHNLDYLRIDEVECKTSPEAYSRKMRRLTDPQDWRHVAVRSTFPSG